MDNFTPFSGFGGGLLIGLSATLLLLLNGRVAGISGIVGGSLMVWRDDFAWRIAFLVGLVLGPVLYAAALGTEPTIALQANTGGLIVAGILVGFGTQLGAGCTSGHGVCGLARGSARSLVATVVFMAVAMMAVYVRRHMFGS